MSTNAAIESGETLGELGFFGAIGYFIRVIVRAAVLFSVFTGFALLRNYIMYKGLEMNSSGILIYACLILAYCLVFDIFYIISEGVFKDIIVGLVISLIGVLIATIFPPAGVVIIILGIISMIRQIISFIKMIPLLLIGGVLSILLLSEYIIPDFIRQFGTFSVSIGKSNFTYNKVMYLYFTITFLISINLGFKYSLKDALFRQTIIFLSIPIICLIFYLVKTRLNTPICEPGEIQSSSIHRGKVFVRGHYRAGTWIKAFWRNRPKLSSL